MTKYICHINPNCSQWNVPADTGGCMCAKPAHEQNALKNIKAMADWRELQRIGDTLESELAFELAKAYPSGKRLARIGQLQQEIRG